MLSFCHFLRPTDTAGGRGAKGVVHDGQCLERWSERRVGVGRPRVLVSHSLLPSVEFLIVVSPAGTAGLMACDRRPIRAMNAAARPPRRPGRGERARDRPSETDIGSRRIVHSSPNADEGRDLQKGSKSGRLA